MIKNTLFIFLGTLVVMGTALKLAGSNQQTKPQGYQLTSCFKCHDAFKDVAVLASKKEQAIERVRSGKMPPGVELTSDEKDNLVKQIEKASR